MVRLEFNCSFLPNVLGVAYTTIRIIYSAVDQRQPLKKLTISRRRRIGKRKATNSILPKCCKIEVDVSKNRGTPKWMVYKGNLIKMDDLGVPLFLETPRWLR